MRVYHIGLKNLKRRRVRTALTILGLALAVAIEVALTGITKSLEYDFSRKLDEYGANILILPKSDDLSLDYGGLSVAGVTFGSEKLGMSDLAKIKAIKNSENIATVVPQLFHAADVNGRNVIVSGVDFNSEFRLKRWWRSSGSRPDEPDDILAGSAAAQALNLKPGDDLEIAKHHFRVAGILTETGSQDDKLIFISLPAAQKVFDKGEALSMIEVSALCYNCPIDSIVAQIGEKLPNAQVMALRQTIETKMDVMHRIRHFSIILSVAVVLFAALMIFVNMMSSITEREKEIGIFRAVGFKRKHVLAVLLFESLIVSLSAGIVGYLFGISGAYLARPLMGLHGIQGFGIDTILTAFALSIFVGVSAAIYPAYKAARLEPTVALRSL